MARFHHRSMATIFCQRQRYLARIYMPRSKLPSCFYLHALVILLKSLRVAAERWNSGFLGGVLRARSALIKPNIMGIRLKMIPPRHWTTQNIRPRTHMRQNLARKCMNLINKSRILLAADLFAAKTRNVPPTFTATKELSWPHSSLLLLGFGQNIRVVCGRRIPASFPFPHYSYLALPLFNMAQIMLAGNLRGLTMHEAKALRMRDCDGGRAQMWKPTYGNVIISYGQSFSRH